MRRAGLLAAMAAGVIGLATARPGFLLLAVVPLGFVVYAELSGRPEPNLAVERSVSTLEPCPGQDVTVTLTIENAGDAPLADVRVADRPPGGVPVEGETAVTASLRAAESVQCEYVLSPPRGTHEFKDPVVRPRSLAGVPGEEREVEVAGDATIVCQTLLDEVSLPDHTVRYIGRTPSDSGGAGVEFYGTREYRRGDPPSRIDWARYARTGRLSTVLFREEQARAVVFLLDDRPGAQWTAPGYGPDSLDLAADAVSRAVPPLLDENHRVGLARATGLADGSIVEPGTGRSTRTTVDDALAEARARTGVAAAADGGDPSEGGEIDGTTTGRRLVAQLPPGAQVVCCTPLSDDFAADLAEVVRTTGHVMTVLSPDLPGRSPVDTPGRTLAVAERTARTRALEHRGVTVVDWDLDEPLELALSRTIGGREGVR